MTPAERNLVRDSMASLQEYAEPVALLFYGKLFELDPSARRLFHHDLALQGRKLMDMLTAVIECIDDLQPMNERLAELGRKHAGYGVRPEQYETVTNALLWSIGQALGPDFDIATRNAWKAAIGAVCTRMLAGVS